MKKINIIIAVVLLSIFSSCVTQKACDRKFPPQESVIVKDSIATRDSIIYKPVDVPVYIKPDTVVKSDTVIIESDTKLPNSKPVYAETEFSKATAQVKSGKLTLTLIQKDTMFKVQAMAKEAYYWKEKYYSEASKEVVEKKVIPKFYNIMTWVGVTILGLLLARGIYKIKEMLSI